MCFGTYVSAASVDPTTSTSGDAPYLRKAAPVLDDERFPAESSASSRPRASAAIPSEA